MRLLFPAFILIALSSLHGQTASDSTIRIKSVQHAQAEYDRAMEGNFHIYNGSQYVAYRPLKDEHPYFLSDDWTNGNILYDGEWFYNVPMLFDTEKNQVIVSYYFKGIKMQLNTQRVREFTVQGHRFIQAMPNDSTGIEPGFYQVLYNGKTTLLAKREKKFIEEITGTELNQYFKETNQYYLWHDNRFEKTGTRQAVLATLTHRKKELKSYIRRNRLFVFDKENSLIQVAQYYDTLQP